MTPFLPGDSLLFAAGTLAAMGALSLPALIGLLFTAAVLGDTLNYAVGAQALASCARAGRICTRARMMLSRARQLPHQATGWAPRRSRSTAACSRRSIWPKRRPFSRNMAPKRHAFSSAQLLRALARSLLRACTHARSTPQIVLARFVPIVRTFAPFVAGVGSMAYSTFVLYNIVRIYAARTTVVPALCIRYTAHAACAARRLARRSGRCPSRAQATFSERCRLCRRTSRSWCWPSSPSPCCRSPTRRVAVAALRGRASAQR